MCLSTNFSAAETNEVYVGELSGGSLVLMILNRTPLRRSFSVDLARLARWPLPSMYPFDQLPEGLEGKLHR